jgi:hypothetical protein
MRSLGTTAAAWIASWVMLVLCVLWAAVQF